MNKYYIYAHIRPNTNQVFYIGKGSGKRAWSKGGRSKEWHKVVNEAGGFDVQILADNLCADFARDLERATIDRFGLNNLVNKINGGGGASKHSLETIEKMRQVNLGKKHTPETCEKMRQSALGKTISPETRDKISKATLGKKKRKQSPEHREKLRQAVLGKPGPNKGKVFSAESREKMRQAKLGKKQSAEHTENNRQAQLRRYRNK